MDYGHRTALRAVKYLCILPASVLFCAPLSDSLFLLTVLLAVYCYRKRYFLAGSIFACFSAFTRVPGILTLAVGVLEWIRSLKELRSRG